MYLLHSVYFAYVSVVLLSFFIFRRGSVVVSIVSADAVYICAVTTVLYMYIILFVLKRFTCTPPVFYCSVAVCFVMRCFDKA